MPRVLSLFSGCGGLDLGFKWAGFELVFANDLDRQACESYRANIGSEITCADVAGLDPASLPDADLLIGGFPCLGFTVANGKRRDLNSHYNALYLEFARILAAKQPRAFLVENVVGIQAGEHFRENFQRAILPSFSSCGYVVSFAVLNAADFLVAQNRRRVIILGRRSDLPGELAFPEPLGIRPTLKDAIADLPQDLDPTLPNHTGSSHGVKINGYVGNRALNWEAPAPTITGRGSRSGGAVIHPHPNLHRRLSVRECARIQSFPDDFIFHGPNGAGYAQIGNAVAPLFAFFLANSLRPFFGLARLDPAAALKNYKLPYLKKFLKKI